MVHPRAGQVALPEDLIDPDELIGAYYDRRPDPDNPEQAVVFGTSGHRGSSLDGAFNEAHIVAITQAIVEYRATAGITGPLFIAKDTHALSLPAWRTAIEVLHTNGVQVLAERDDEFTPTPALSRAVIEYNRCHHRHSDGIVVTPSHNPPRDGGFKYNPPHGGPAEGSITAQIAARANELLHQTPLRRVPYAQLADQITRFDYRTPYCTALSRVIDTAAIAASGIHIGADPLGGASLAYWEWIAAHLGFNLDVVNHQIDPRWAFMTLDSDGQIRMDCSSPYAMASLVANRSQFDIATGNDADSDRHGIVTPDAGLMNPNHYLAVAIEYLFTHRPDWPTTAGIGKTLVSSSMIDKVAAELNRRLVEVPVGFKWFVPGLSDSSIGFGGEESAGASFLQRDGTTWTTDKDGILLALLASEITAVTGSTPSQLYDRLTERYGTSYYQRQDADATRTQKARLGALQSNDISATELAHEPITQIFATAPGNGAPIGGIKVTTASGWFAARPSGTEDKYKIYAESFRSAAHLQELQAQAAQVVSKAISQPK